MPSPKVLWARNGWVADSSLQAWFGYHLLPVGGVLVIIFRNDPGVGARNFRVGDSVITHGQSATNRPPAGGHGYGPWATGHGSPEAVRGRGYGAMGGGVVAEAVMVQTYFKARRFKHWLVPPMWSPSRAWLGYVALWVPSLGASVAIKNCCDIIITQVQGVQMACTFCNPHLSIVPLATLPLGECLRIIIIMIIIMSSLIRMTAWLLVFNRSNHWLQCSVFPCMPKETKSKKSSNLQFLRSFTRSLSC